MQLTHQKEHEHIPQNVIGIMYYQVYYRNEYVIFNIATLSAMVIVMDGFVCTLVLNNEKPTMTTEIT